MIRRFFSKTLLKTVFSFLFFISGNSQSALILDFSGSGDFKNIRNALTSLKAGDTLLVKAGSYPWTQGGSTPKLPLSAVGTAQNKIVVMPFEDHKVTLLGLSSEKEGFIYLSGSWWEFRGLVFNGKNIRSISLYMGGNNNGFISCEFKNNPLYGCITMAGKNNFLDSCTVHSTWPTSSDGYDRHGLAIQTSDNAVVRNSTFYNCHGDGIQIHASKSTPESKLCKNTLIENNLFYVDVGLADSQENGLDIKSCRGAVVRNNVFHGFRRSYGSDGTALNVHFDAQDVTIEGNEFYDSQNAIRINSGSWVGYRPDRVIIRRNLIRDLTTDKFEPDKFVSSLAIKLDGCANVSVYHNTVVGAKHFLWIPDSGGKYMHSQLSKTLLWGDNGTGYGAGSHTGVENLIFQNNLFVNALVGLAGNLDSAKGNVTFSHNGFHNAGTVIPGDLNAVHGNPVFNSGSGDPFSLQDGSPMIDAGVLIPGVSVADGKPDIGAFEFGRPGQSLRRSPSAAGLRISAFPNPFSTSIKILIPNIKRLKKPGLKIFGLNGSLVYSGGISSFSAGSGVTTWTPGKWVPAGAYIIQIGEKNVIQKIKIFKQ